MPDHAGDGRATPKKVDAVRGRQVEAPQTGGREVGGLAACRKLRGEDDLALRVRHARDGVDAPSLGDPPPGREPVPHPGFRKTALPRLLEGDQALLVAGDL